LERSFEAEKKEKAQVFSRFDEDITELDRRASRHRHDIEKVDSKVDKMAKWEEKCQTLTNDLLACVQILEERDADKNGQILELTEKVLELEGRVESMSDKLCRCHWGRGDLETSGNILGKLWALDHFSPNVSTNHILGTFRL